MPRLPASLEVLRERDYRLLFTGQAVSLLGDGMFNVALAFAVLHLGGSATQVGLVFAARMCRWSRACWPAASSPTGCRAGP